MLSGALGAEVSGINLKDSSFENWNKINDLLLEHKACLLYTSPSPRDVEESRMPSSA